MGVTRYLIWILGRRSALTFGLVTLLVGALLSTVNMASRHALKRFVEDQLGRIHWDLAVYQTTGVSSPFRLQEMVRATGVVTRVESLVFLRAKLPEGDIAPVVDDQPLGTPWLSLLTATDPSLFPPDVRGVSWEEGNGAGGAVLALVGPERAMGKAFAALQGARQFSLTVQLPGGGEAARALQLPIRSVIRLERNQLNRWLMDQVGSISFIPHVGVLLVAPYDAQLIRRFEAVATGLLHPELLGLAPGTDLSHIQLGEYIPETVTVARLDREALISGWDIEESLGRVGAVREGLQGLLEEWGARLFVDSTTEVLLHRMAGIARLVGLLALLIALPLLWMAWVLAANFAGLLMLNERRTLGLMRLRGVPGRLLGRALLLSIAGGGLGGGAAGLVLGSLLPLALYEGGRMPLAILLEGRQLFFLLLYLLVGVGLALLVSRRLIHYATTISPLEAAGRVAASEATRVQVRFGPAQGLCLFLGIYTLADWIFRWGFLEQAPLAALRLLDKALDFVGLPLFLYGLIVLMASRGRWIRRLLEPVVRPMGGQIGGYAVQHMAVKPHRTVSFLLIIALMTSVSLYPTITAESFREKAERGARVQMGGDLQLIFNAPDLSGREAPQGELREQLESLGPGLRRLREAVQGVAGVRAVIPLLEAVLPNFYLPGYGLRGVPFYLLEDVDAYLREVYWESELGLSAPFKRLLQGVGKGQVALSPPVAEFWRTSPGDEILVGMDMQRRSLGRPSAGTVAFLAGTPPLTITDRQGYVQARVDYLNHLFSNHAYLVGSSGEPGLASLAVLIPRVMLLVRLEEGFEEDRVLREIRARLPIPPLEVNRLSEEFSKVGSDMFIALALENMRVYLVGGVLLALIAILAVALANYAEDRRTLALLRIRGASLGHIWRFLAATLLSPALLGLLLGIGTALLAGYGLANYLWQLREIQNVVQLLSTHLVPSLLTLWVALWIILCVLGISWGAGRWIYRRTAREHIQEG